MYAIAIIRYRAPLEKVLEHVEAHRAYLGDLNRRGIVVVSGPLDPRYGGAAIIRIPDEDGLAGLDRIRDGDPYVRAGVAQWEVLGWRPGTGAEVLERVGLGKGNRE